MVSIRRICAIIAAAGRWMRQVWPLLHPAMLQLIAAVDRAGDEKSN